MHGAFSPAKSKENTLPEELLTPAEETAAPVEGTNETPGSAPGDSTEPPAEKPKVTGGFQKRIDKLTREKEHWKDEALKALQKPVASSATEAPKTDGKPQVDNFKTHAEYVEALTDWKVAEKVKEFRAEQNAEKAKAAQKTVESNFQEKQKAFKEATPDFDEVMAEADMQVSRAVIDEIVNNENGPALQYFLAKNPDEAARLSQLSPVALAREVGRIESRFVTAPSSTKTATVTRAPAPPNPVTRSSSTATKDMGDPNLSNAEYMALRRKAFPNSRVF